MSDPAANSHVYAGWFVVDLRLLGFVTLVSAFLTLGLVALLRRAKRWHEYATAFVTIFIVVMILSILVFNRVARYPVFSIETMFSLP